MIITSSITETAQQMADGAIAVFPTETVWGIGGRIDAAVLDRLAEIKGRSEGKPFQLLVHDMVLALELIGENPAARAAARHFWPGPLTMVVGTASERLQGVQQWLMPKGEVGLRMPASHAILELAGCCGGFIAATSANFAGAAAPQSFDQLDEALLAAVDVVLRPEREALDGSGRASTVVRIGADGCEVLREGAVTAEQLKHVCACGKS